MRQVDRRLKDTVRDFALSAQAGQAMTFAIRANVPLAAGNACRSAAHAVDISCTNAGIRYESAARMPLGRPPLTPASRNTR